MTCSRIRVASAAALLWLGLAGAAVAQEVDADYRVYDTVRLKAGESLEGTILSGREPGSGRLKIRTTAGIEMEVARSEVAEIVARETPESAFKSRAKGLASGGAPGLHRRLAEWGYGLGLLEGAIDQLRLAVEREPEAAARVGHRARLVELLEERAAGLPEAGRDAIHEEIVAQASGKDPRAPRVALGYGRVLLHLDLPDMAVPVLRKARQELEERAADAPAPNGGDAPGDGGDAPGDGGDAPGDGGEDEDDGEGEPPPERQGDDGPVRRFGRDGAPLERERAEGPAGGGGQAADAVDRGAELLPGLEESQRRLYRDVLATLAKACEDDDDPDGAEEAWAKLREVWPQDRAATLGHAPLLAGRGELPAAIAAVGEALGVHQNDPLAAG
jgi:tetratricopeptide (TPR) repeat protein